MPLCNRSFSKPQVRAHHLKDERVGAQGIGSIAAPGAGCMSLSTLATIGKILSLLGTPVCQGSGSTGTKDPKDAKLKSPSTSLSLFCGISKTRDPKTGAPAPPAPGTPAISIPLPKWPFGASGVEATALATPEVVPATRARPTAVPAPPAEPTARAPSIRLSTSTEVLRSPRPASVPRLRDMPGLDIQPSWRVPLDDPNESDGDADECFVDSDSTLQASTDDEIEPFVAETEPLAPAAAADDKPAKRRAARRTRKVKTKKPRFAPPEHLRV